MANETAGHDPAAQPVRPAPGKALIITLLVIPVIAGYLVLAATLGIAAGFAGFLFLLYWTGLKHGAIDEFAPALVGALGGVATAWLLVAAPAALGPVGYVPALLLILFSIFALIVGWLPMLFNYSFMLLLTVATIPALGTNAMFAGMIAAILLSGAYFGGLMLLMRMLGARRARAAAA